jgi:hypothetical protein
MTTATVYHARNPNFGMGAPLPLDAANYRVVAILQTGVLGEVFRLTSNASWHENPEVRALVGPCRATCVGDVVVLSDETGSRAFRVVNAALAAANANGWAQI